MCPKHGTDYLEYKCRYCCSVAVFFCFGTTHFCNACHDDFQARKIIFFVSFISMPMPLFISIGNFRQQPKLSQFTQMHIVMFSLKIHLGGIRTRTFRTSRACDDHCATLPGRKKSMLQRPSFRVTRLGDFSPIGQLFSLGSFLETI
jgi:hypothetical protein